METRVALIAIIIKDRASSANVNAVLHDYGDYMIGRMGLPYRQKNLNIISVAIDAPQEVIAAISGKIGAMEGVQAKTVYTV